MPIGNCVQEKIIQNEQRGAAGLLQPPLVLGAIHGLECHKLFQEVSQW